MRRITAISQQACTREEYEDNIYSVIAACDDGTIWQGRWERVLITSGSEKEITAEEYRDLCSDGVPTQDVTIRKDYKPSYNHPMNFVEDRDHFLAGRDRFFLVTPEEWDERFIWTQLPSLPQPIPITIGQGEEVWKFDNLTKQR